MRLALVSLNQIWLDKKTNFSRCGNLAKAAADQGCDLIIFPEMTLTGYSLDAKAIAEPAEHSSSMKWFGELSKNVGIDVIFGACLWDSESEVPQNSLCLANRKGESVVIYSKMHPFSFAGEASVLKAGQSLGFAKSADFLLGCSICYDLRFPELFSIMAANCNAVVNIANWPVQRIAHWRALLVARAIENQLFVFGVNRIGTDGNGLQYEESSMAIAPDGTVLKPVHSDIEIAIYEFNSMETKEYREAFPTVRDKRYDLYQKLYQGIQIAE